jgi:sterol desaturase/sphingolipid hydroxylase (fatty acid hydroxylase superfamily)
MLSMMALADGLRYWLHRWAHEWELLWRFHAVHHAPQKLYWLNVGRFHPVDKGLQVLLDTLPFLLLGVSEDVLAFYVVCYAINGFFQHCNIDVRLGILNYMISGPELHRWHHSMVKHESNHNYGNNLIIWDLLFGTWHLPPERMVRDLGLVNRAYPSAFLQQMTAPFLSGADKQTVES